MRIKRLPREAAAFVMIRRKGVSINMIAAAFGRSTSFVYRILKANFGLSIRKIDLRKLPSYIRLRTASYQRILLLKLLKRWENFILGEGEKPP